ncbi:hypothetical protein KCTC32516_00687 [Polaribacter huanghezhanensis]|uniref:hypothetical protein n=1 Tax=Polaribacter huanghezhanensis TaxID=1354726 RepID=UPI0026473386|nr:hypothetical protein [Polaribacter huanghezhanensis]WKD85347.1 hypothetical protein KCTC32516_00687 [Polaribacter huanghezhanensis]
MAKFIITCDEATTICDKSQYGEATLFEKIKLNAHFILCKICGLYSKQNTKMTEIYKMKAHDCKNEQHCLSSEEKEHLKKELQESEA